MATRHRKEHTFTHFENMAIKFTFQQTFHFFICFYFFFMIPSKYHGKFILIKINTSLCWVKPMAWALFYTFVFLHCLLTTCVWKGKKRLSLSIVPFFHFWGLGLNSFKCTKILFQYRLCLYSFTWFYFTIIETKWMILVESKIMVV